MRLKRLRGRLQHVQVKQSCGREFECSSPCRNYLAGFEISVQSCKPFERIADDSQALLARSNEKRKVLVADDPLVWQISLNARPRRRWKNPRWQSRRTRRSASPIRAMQTE
jgi:hypothetical protein